MIPYDFNFTIQNRGECSAHSDNLRSNKGEGSLRGDTPPPNKSAHGTRDIVVLDERTGVFPVAEANSETNVRIEKGGKSSQRELHIVVWSASKVKNDSKNNEANDGQDLDGTDDATRVSQLTELIQDCVHARKHELGFSVCAYQPPVSTGGRSHRTEIAY